MARKRFHAASQEEVKELCFRGLLRFRDFCEAHHLSYTLMYGTLIGAVRHQDFIPWDDDVDVAMPRKDYEELIRLWTDDKDADWRLLSYQTEADYCLPWAKLCHTGSRVLPSRFSSGLVYGCSIDVFPLDAAPDTDAEAERIHAQLGDLYRTQGARYRCWDSLQSGMSAAVKRFVKRMYFRAYSLLHGRWSVQLEKLDRIVAETSRGSSGSSLMYMYDFDRICRWDAEDFGFADPQQEKLDFRGERFCVPKRYDSVLRAYYGDYMMLPPEEKRVTQHTYLLQISDR